MREDTAQQGLLGGKWHIDSYVLVCIPVRDNNCFPLPCITYSINGTTMYLDGIYNHTVIKSQAPPSIGIAPSYVTEDNNVLNILLFLAADG